MEAHDDRERSASLSRRSLLRVGGGVLLAGPMTTLLAACGGSAQSPTATGSAGGTGNSTTAQARAGASQTSAGATTGAGSAVANTGATASAGKINPGGVLTVAIGTDISSLEPQVTTETSSAGVRANLYDQLVWQFTPKGDIQPWLATKWEASPDGLTYTFTLVDKPVKFHDGSAFNADAVKATYDRLLAPSRSGAAKLTLTVVTKVEAPDPKTVRFTLANVFAPFLRRVADSPGAIMSPAAIQKYGEDYGTNPIGTGPYKFVEYKKGDHVAFAKNPNYWNGSVNYDTLTYKIVPEDASRGTLLQTGEAQVSDRVPPVLAQQLSSNKDVAIQQDITSRYIMFVLNENRDLMKNVQVRQAVNYGIDKKAIVQNILKGYAIVAESPLTKVIEFSKPQPVYEFDLAKAKSLLQAAGVAPGTKLVIWTPQGRYTGDKDFATAVQDMMKNLGFDAQLQAFGDFPTYLTQLDTLQYDMAVWGWANSNDADSGLNQLYSSKFVKKFPNWGSYSNPKVDDLLNTAVSTLDTAKRADLYAQAQQIIWHDAASVFMHWQENLTGVSKKITGVFVTAAETLIVRDSGYTA